MDEMIKGQFRNGVFGFENGPNLIPILFGSVFLEVGIFWVELWFFFIRVHFSK